MVTKESNKVINTTTSHSLVQQISVQRFTSLINHHILSLATSPTRSSVTLYLYSDLVFVQQRRCWPRNTSCERWKAQTRRTPACWSTSVGRSTATQELNRRSTPNIFSPAARWSWSSLLPAPKPWFLSACGRRCQGTLWFPQTVQCWHKDLYVCRHHTS